MKPASLWSALAGALVAAVAVCAASAQDDRVGDLTITHAWSPPPLAGRTESAAYFTIRNAGDADRLVAASTQIAETAELHAHVMTGDVMRMEKVDAVEVPAGGEVVFAPGGRHVMLFGLKEGLAPGETFPLTLTFEHAGDVEATVAVETLAENLAPNTDHSEHHP